jgi:type VI secretion system secreted protein VgrG
VVSQHKRRIKLTTPLGTDALAVTRLSGQEAISQPFYYRLECSGDSAEAKFESMVRQQVTVNVESLKDDRLIHGIVTRLVQGRTDPIEKTTSYTIELRPWFWLLTHTLDSRVFQNQTAPDIISTVLDQFEFKDYDKSKLKATYTKRVYCTQYRESAFDFVSRLMEEEGIFYFFEHKADKHTMVLADSSDAHATCVPDAGKLAYRYPTHKPREEPDTVYQCFLEEEVTTDKYTVSDFNFETPTTSLLAKTGDGGLEVYEYPALFEKKDGGPKLATRRVEERELRKRELRGTSHCRELTAGAKFTVEGQRTDIAGDWVVRSTNHTGDDGSYTIDFRAFPLATPFRPTRVSARPRIQGSQTAVVVGKSGEEIETDTYGRIKVQFHWDRLGEKNEKSSCWVRVAQMSAGKSWGQVYIPRIGTEVVVTFIDGDPDRPLVTGCVYNGENALPYKLPDNKTQSGFKSRTSKGGEGFNELRFEDKKGEEQLKLHAQKDMRVDVLNDVDEVIGQHRRTTIEKADDTLTISEGNRAVTVTKGDETYTIGGKRTVTVTKLESRHNKDTVELTIDKDYTVTIKGNLKLVVDGNIEFITKKTFSLEADMDIKTTSKKASILTAESKVEITGKAKVTVQSDGTLRGNAADVLMTAQNKALLKGTSLIAQGSGTAKVTGSSLLKLKGGTVKIN